jgi:hypothetical protein
MNVYNKTGQSKSWNRNEWAFTTKCSRSGEQNVAGLENKIKTNVMLHAINAKQNLKSTEPLQTKSTPF